MTDKQGTYISCEECGLVVQTVELNDSTKAVCPRCSHTLTQKVAQATQQINAYGIACLIAFAMSIAFQFMDFNAKGLVSKIHLWDAAVSMAHFNYDILSVLTIICVFVLPIVFILIVMFLYNQSERSVKQGHPTLSLPLLRFLTSFIHHAKPWLMVDVFLTGVLIALVKILSLAKVSFGMSFWALCIYTVLLVKFMSMVDIVSLWDKFKPRLLTDKPDLEVHRSDKYDECPVCSQVSPIHEGTNHHCIRCEAKLKPFDPMKNLQFSWALLIAAAVFYIPANLYPIMYTTSVGSTATSTIMSGVALLWSYKSYPVAMVIFLVSIIIPIAKVMTLCGIYWNAQKQKVTTEAEALKQLKLYRITEFIGRWSMIDIFVVALLSALVQLGRAMSIEPGMAGVCFGLVVILTMISAHLFDPRSLWHFQHEHKMQEKMQDTHPLQSQTSQVKPLTNNHTFAIMQPMQSKVMPKIFSIHPSTPTNLFEASMTCVNKSNKGMTYVNE